METEGRELDMTRAFLRPAPPRYRPRRGWHLGLRPGMSVATCRHIRWGFEVLNMFGGVILGGIFLGYVLEF